MEIASFICGYRSAALADEFSTTAPVWLKRRYRACGTEVEEFGVALVTAIACFGHFKCCTGRVGGACLRRSELLLWRMTGVKKIEPKRIMSPQRYGLVFVAFRCWLGCVVCEIDCCCLCTLYPLPGVLWVLLSAIEAAAGHRKTWKVECLSFVHIHPLVSVLT